MRLIQGTCVLVAILMLTGCAINLGSNNTPNRGTTLGKELMDLKEARDRGVLSDAEYEQQRTQILHRYNHGHDHDKHDH